MQMLKRIGSGSLAMHLVDARLGRIEPCGSAGNRIGRAIRISSLMDSWPAFENANRQPAIAQIKEIEFYLPSSFANPWQESIACVPLRFA